MLIHNENPADIEGIRTVNQQAFGQPQESRLVDALRANGGILLSLVAAADEHIVGHILYSPVALEKDGAAVIGAGLGPAAVLPAYQRRGIGGRLVETGNHRLRSNGCPFVVVLGHPEYYPRFGFVPASRHGVRCEWDVPDEAFLILVMDRTVMPATGGFARYRSEFNAVV